MFSIQIQRIHIRFLRKDVCLRWSITVCIIPQQIRTLAHRCADMQVWAPAHGRSYGVENHAKPYATLVFPYVLQHAVAFESIVVLSRTDWLLRERIPWYHDKALAYHRANTFAALRLRLMSEKTAADDITIVTIAALTTVDVSIFPSTASFSKLKLF